MEQATPKRNAIAILIMPLLLLACEAEAPSSLQADYMETARSNAAEDSPGSSSPFVWVTSTLNEPTVSIIDTGNNAIVATVPVPTSLDMAFTPDGRFAYLPNSTADGTVTVLDTETLAVVATVKVGDFPRGVAITPDGAFAYVANTFSHTVSVIETATNAVLTTLPVDGLGEGVAAALDGSFVYVTTRGGVAVIETATNTVVETIEVGGGHHVGITPDGALLYVTRGLGISVIATATNSVVATIPGPPFTPSDVAFTPDGAFAYVTYPLERIVAIVSTASSSVIGTVDVGEGGRGIAVTPDGEFVYVAVSGAVVVVETATNMITDVVETPPGTWALAIAPERTFGDVQIDIKPGEQPNSINCNNERGLVPVAIMSSPSFDATTMDHGSVMFHGATEVHRDRRTGAARGHPQDVDLDGDTDLVFHFRFGETSLDCSSTEALLVGGTLTGTKVRGTDAVRMVTGRR